jgi:secreted Zn-dependent insulinase-like peptidase
MNQVEILNPPIKSKGDKNDYRLIKLPNGLKALLIHTHEDTSLLNNEILAAAALTVGVASFDEPSNIGGLAHFLEHMLFMGSEKYPDESGYNQIVAENGGYNNASTDNEHTYYYFDVSESAFPETLDRFAQQFISPLMLREAMQREREAVDSEFQMAMARDHTRMEVFCRTFINENHPASYFD